MCDTNRLIFEFDIVDGDYRLASSTDMALAMAIEELSHLEETIQSVRALKPDCDKLDYALAASSGAICGLIDIFLVGKPGETRIGNIGDGWFKERVTDFAKINGWSDESNKTAIRFLEDKFKIPYDQTGGGIASEIFDLTPTNHHFKSLGHNPTLLGLFFSILDQFTNRSHFVTEGQLVALNEADGKFELHGNGLPAKFFCGFANWFGHLISDMTGSSSSKGRGMGVPSPFWAWTNDVIAIGQTLRISTPELVKNMNSLALEIYNLGYDARFQAVQAIPILVNEAIVRLLYSIRRLIKYLAVTSTGMQSFSSMWKACEPFSNPTVKRMLTVAHGTLCMIDVGDATVRAFANGAGGFNAPEFFMRLNVVGVGRFAVSLYGEGQRAIRSCSAQADARFAQRKMILVEDYIAELSRLANLYDDKQLVRFVEEFEQSDMYVHAFELSAHLAELRNVPDKMILKNKSNIDAYFTGGE